MTARIERAFWHHHSGKSYQEAFHQLILNFDVVTKSWKKDISSPTYYCAGMAIEHFLKGYLILEGLLSDNNSRSHDLKKLIFVEESRIKEFFGLDDVEINDGIERLNERYYEHDVYGRYDLRYPSMSGLRESPQPDFLDEILMKMERRLRKELLEKRMKLKNQGD